jgi:hypothetical protein
MVKRPSDKVKTARSPKRDARPGVRPPAEADIRERAYQLFLARGAEPGRELEDWLQAERELTGS